MQRKPRIRAREGERRREKEREGEESGGGERQRENKRSRGGVSERASVFLSVCVCVWLAEGSSNVSGRFHLFGGAPVQPNWDNSHL